MPTELKPCPFCHEMDSDGRAMPFGNFYLRKDRILGWRLHSAKNCCPIHIRFCPMCGRDLLKES